MVSRNHASHDANGFSCGWITVSASERTEHRHTVPVPVWQRPLGGCGRQKSNLLTNPRGPNFFLSLPTSQSIIDSKILPYVIGGAAAGYFIAKAMCPAESAAPAKGEAPRKQSNARIFFERMQKW